MKVMLHKNAAGHLSVYVPKKDLEEEVVKETVMQEGILMTLANGWELLFSKLEEPLKLPITTEAKKIA
jgi:nitrogen fixation protein NifT